METQHIFHFYTKALICRPTLRVQVIMSICLIHSPAFCRGGVSRDRPICRPRRYIGRYLGLTDISVSAKTADIIDLNRSWQNAFISLTYADNLRKKAQRSKSRQLSYNNASKCGFINKQTRLAMERASAVTTETKASSGSFAMLEATTCRCCVRINSRCTSGSFRSTKSLTGT